MPRMIIMKIIIKVGDILPGSLCTETFIMRIKLEICQIGAFLLSITLSAMAADESVPELNPQRPAVRRPVDICQSEGFVFTANHGSGSISVIDADRLLTVQEFHAGKHLAALESWGTRLLVLDNSRHQLLTLQYSAAEGKMRILDRCTVADHPVDIAISDDGSLIAVSSLWSRMVTLLEPNSAGLPQIRNAVPLDFAPRRLLFTQDQQLLVADSFGGSLCLVDTVSGKAGAVLQINGHNIRGLAHGPDGRSVLVTAQTLNSDTFTTYERVFWGVLMRNSLHTVPLAAFQSAAVSSPTRINETYAGGSYSGISDRSDTADVTADAAAFGLYPLGTPSIGSGDPGQLIVTADDITMLVVSGTNQVAYRVAGHLPFERMRVGRRPESLCVDADRRLVFVAGRFDDSVSVIDLEGKSPALRQIISLGTQRELTPVEQGERAFYDASLSLDGWYSCHSCHTDGHTNGLLSDTFGDEDLGAPKKVLSLLGTGDTGPWAWTGGRGQLEEQVTTSLIISMQCQLETEELPVVELSSYLRTLVPPPSVQAARRDQVNQQLLEAGRKLFQQRGCIDCHAGVHLTSTDSWDTGLHDELGVTHFNPPSLRGVSQRRPWFHDGRADTLEDVLRSSHHDQSAPLPVEEIGLLKAYLESL